jgi:crotonobetainyl-CoA:carnitine CoA-transferase CaiB-like acyl-CoA transferase
VLKRAFKQRPDLSDDGHTKARRLVYEQAQPDGTSKRIVGTCTKTNPDDGFAPPGAPHVGQHTEEVLTRLAGYDAAGIEQLRSTGTI